MLKDLLKFCTRMVNLIMSIFVPSKKKTRAIRIPRNYNDTSNANYAINENGYLERIRHDKLSNHHEY